MSGLCVNTGTRSLPAQPVFLEDDGPYFFTPRKVARVAYDIREVVALLEQEQDVRQLTIRRQDDWLRRGFGEEQWEHIAARRADPEDLLAQHHIDVLYGVLVGVATQLLKAG